MNFVGVGMLLAGLATAAQGQTVWRCQVGEQVQFSDRPCADQGRPLAERALQPNLADAPKPRPAPLMSKPVEAAPVRPQPVGNVCPSDAELRSMETRASSTSFADEAKQFLQDEIRRALQCRKGQGRYTDADWAVSREAQAAQSSLSGALDARTRAEAMHSAADPEEGDRIFRRNLAQARLDRQERNRQQAVQNPPALPR